MAAHSEFWHTNKGSVLWQNIWMVNRIIFLLLARFWKYTDEFPLSLMVSEIKFERMGKKVKIPKFECCFKIFHPIIIYIHVS